MTHQTRGLPDLPLDLLLRHVVNFIRRFVVLSDAAVIAVALWVVHTHAFAAADTTPYLTITAATKRTGKTRLLEVLAVLVVRPWLAARVSAAVLVRKVDKEKPTLLLDETDAAFKVDSEYSEALRGLLNSGFRRSGQVSLCVGQGASINYVNLSTFCAKAFAGIGALPATVADRSIAIVLKRRTRDEPVERFRERDVQLEAHPLFEQVAKWAAAHLTALRAARPVLPEALGDRAQDVWEPLFAIADAAGGTWPARARAAAVELAGIDETDEPAFRLLSDLHAVWPAGDEAVRSKALTAALAGIEDAPWSAWRSDKPLTQHGLAKLLKTFSIAPMKIRFGAETAQGYARHQFEDAWVRYPPLQVEQWNNINNDGPQLAISRSEQNETCSDHKTATSTNSDGLCSTVPLGTPDLGDGDDRDTVWARADARFKAGWNS